MKGRGRGGSHSAPPCGLTLHPAGPLQTRIAAVRHPGRRSRLLRQSATAAAGAAAQPDPDQAVDQGSAETSAPAAAADHGVTSLSLVSCQWPGAWPSSPPRLRFAWAAGSARVDVRPLRSPQWKPQPSPCAHCILPQTDLQRLLRLRGLSSEGSKTELQQRLAAFLSDPSGFPEARCEPRPVTLLGGRLFASQATLRSHIQLLLNVLLGEDIEEGHPDFAFLLALLQQHPRYADKVRGCRHCGTCLAGGASGCMLCWLCGLLSYAWNGLGTRHATLAGVACCGSLIHHFSHLPASPPAALQVQPPVVAFRVQVVEDSELQPLRFFEFLDARGQWEDFSYRKCIG